MRFHSDHYFHIGAAHLTAGKPCQDFSLSRAEGTTARIVVSDGCSTGGHTDIGARIIALSTLQALDIEPLEPERVARRRDSIATSARAVLGLNRSDLLATCLYAAVGAKGGFYHVQGDGATAVKYLDGSMLLTRYEWADNTPFYPAYLRADRDLFVERHGGAAAAGRLIVEAVFCDPSGKNTHSWRELPDVLTGIRGITVDLCVAQLERARFIAVFSDGVSQVENVSWTEAVHAFMAIKSTAGEFAKRRMIRGIKDMRERGKGPVDDISCAMICVDHEEAA